MLAHLTQKAFNRRVRREFAEHAEKNKSGKNFTVLPTLFYPQRFSLRSQRLFSAHSAVKGFYLAASTPAPTSDSKIFMPSVHPNASSLARSGCGIIPST